MNSPSISIAAVVRSELINMDGVAKFSPNRRFATVYSEGSPSDSLFFLEAGLVKILKRGDDNKEIILQIVSPGELFGEQALGAEPARSMAAEVLQEGVIYIVPRDLFVRACNDHPELWREISSLLTARKRQLEKKIELLCLRDVEYRILYG
jgi:CRP/FNR family cyclic AMP-dependent transcriptional regulator